MSVAQLFPYVLPSITIAPNTEGTVPLKDLPLRWIGLFAHVVKFLIQVEVTPTHTTAPTTVGINNTFSKFDFWDGKINRHVGGLNSIRSRERLSTGRVRFPDADTNTASGTARRFSRVLHVGPPHLAGGQSDFMMPCAALTGGELRWQSPAVTQLSADCTNYTGSARVVAMIRPDKTLRIPPAYTFQSYTASAADVPVPGEALYESVSMLNSASNDAITAGDFGAVKLDLGNGDVIQSVRGRDLQAAYWDDFEVGEIGAFGGDPLNSSDDAHKIVDHSSPTAIAAGPQDLQVVLTSPKGCSITKLAKCDSSARLQWDGSQGTAVIQVGRILPQDRAVIAGYVANAISRLELGVPRSIEPKTMSKKPLTRPGMQRFFPHEVKF